VVTLRTLWSHFLALEILAGANRGAIVGVRHIAVEIGLGGAFILETARDRDDALPIIDRHGAGLNHRLSGKIALGRDHRPGAVHGAVVPRKPRDREKQSHQNGFGNFRGWTGSHNSPLRPVSS